MAKKQTVRLVWPLVVLVLLVGLILLLIDPFGWRTPGQEKLKAQDPARFTLCAATADEITAIEITKPLDEPFTLARDGENWFVERGGKRYRAEQSRVDSMLQDLPGLETDSLATDNADQHANYEVDDAHGIKMVVYTGEQVACNLIIGKAAPSYQSAFVRKPDEDKVYRSSKNLKSLVGFAYTNFRGKLLWPFDPTGATELSITAPDGMETASFSRVAGAFWQNPDGSNGNQNAINELLNSFSGLRINDYVDDTAGVDTGLAEEPAPTVSVTAEGVFSLELGRHDEEKNQYYLRDQDGFVSLVSAANISFLLEADIVSLKMEQLPEEPEAPAGEGETGLQIEVPVEAGS